MDALLFFLLFAAIEVAKVVAVCLLLIAFAGSALWIAVLIALSLMRALFEGERHARHNQR